ncbi:uncharacterized protein [Atheta coriaria]|uniref:uncharacterized protein isoform X2 n=1 Tax=Dalotia coriaria TaxID=877792 RepID=UPI0031F40561
MRAPLKKLSAAKVFMCLSSDSDIVAWLMSGSSDCYCFADKQCAICVQRTTTSAMNGKKGAAVAAAVAFLERQQQQKSKPMLHQQTTDKNVKIAVARDNITVASNENCADANKLLNGVAPTMSAVAEKRKKFDANRPKVFARQTSENSENRISNVEKTLPRSDDDHVNTFEGAVLDFDLTAEDVQKFVAESMRKIESATQEAQDCMIASTTSEYVASDDFEDSTSESSSSGGSSSESDTEEECKDLPAGLATIAEEDVGVSSCGMHSTDEGEDASSDDGSTTQEDESSAKLKQTRNKPESSAKRTDSPSSDSSSSTPETNRKDSSTRCNGDFQWIPPKHSTPLTDAKPPINRNHSQSSAHRDRTPRRALAGDKSAPGSLDRRRNSSPRTDRQERDQKSRSSYALKSPPRLEDFVNQSNFHGGGGGCQNWCCNPSGPAEYYENFHRRHERLDPMRYGSNPMLMCGGAPMDQQQRGSHPNLYSNTGSGNHLDYQSQSLCGCGCGYPHMPMMPPFYYDPRAYHWGPPLHSNKLPDQDERFRKLQQERDNLQLQVQVLSEQIDAQNEKISDVEKSLAEKKQMLISAEDTLQREMLSRSSLETQKLELMSAISEMKLQQAALERENLELKTAQQQQIANSAFEAKKAAFLARMSPQPALTSTPVHSSSQLRKSPSPSPVTVGSLSASPRRSDGSDHQSPKTPPASYRRQIELQYSSLPRQQFLSNGGTSFSVVDANANPSSSAGAAAMNGGVKKGVAFAETEKIVIGESNNPSVPQSPSLQFNNKKGIKKIFGKIKRSNSGTLDDFSSNCSDFQRGGVRATASARLGWSEPTPPLIKPDKPFAEWDTENICDWLQDLGLDQYVVDAKRWVKNGQHLQEASLSEIEKELAIKNPLHKKKLQLALIDIEENSSSDPYLSKAGKLDTAWVLRWLDDTGLPQHKENFLLNRIDGRVLHRLTMDDLALLHVTALLHVASIKRGIQVLRENNYEPGCLQRRTLPEDPEHATAKQISLWTTHRVMEWLKAVDLAEYAPNLRGAGVHGGLMVLENKFNAELLAALLSIPANKTLLRRHLNTHFKELLGKDVIQAKREAEGTLGYIPLTPSAKLKVAKKSHFSLKRSKSKSEADYGDLVCPLNANSGENCQNGSPNIGMTKRNGRDEVVYHLVEDDSLSGSSTNSPIPERHEF